MLHADAHPRRRSRLLVAGLAIVGLMSAVVLVLHLPPVRAVALRYLTRAALAAGVRIEAGGLHYNVATLRVGLDDVRVAAVGHDEPFFRAARLEALLSRQIFSGHVRFDEVRIEQGSVRIIRDSDGRMNLPESGSSDGAEPQALPIERLVAPQMAVEYLDRTSPVEVSAQQVSLDLSPHGRVAIGRPVDVAFGSVRTRITEFAGDLSFDGRDLALADLRIETPEARVGVSGGLAILRQQPRTELRLTGDGDLERLASLWGQSGDRPRGRVEIEGEVRGTLEDPAVDLRAGSTRITWNGLNLDAVSARAHLDRQGAVIEDGRVRVADGAVSLTSKIDWASSQATTDVTWRDLDLSRLLSPWMTSAPIPSGLASGQLSAKGAFDQESSWEGQARVVVAPATARIGHIAVPGELSLRLNGSQWSLDSTIAVGGTLPVAASLAGTLRGATFSDSTLTGRIAMAESPLEEIARLLAQADVLAPVEGLPSGTVRAEVALAGTIGQPALSANLSSDAVSISGQELVDLKMHSTLRGSTLVIDEFTAWQPGLPGDARPRGLIQLGGTYDLQTNKYTASLRTGLLRVEPSSGVPVSGPFSVEFDGEGQGRVVKGTGRVTASLTLGERFELGELTSTVVLDGDVAHVTASAPQFAASATGDVSLSPPYATTAHVEATALDLQRLVRQLGLVTAVEGAADVRVDAEGPLERWREGRASVDITRLESALGSAATTSVPFDLRREARLRYEGGRVWIDSLDASLGETTLSASGSLAAFDEPVSGAAGAEPLLATLTGDVSDLAVVSALVDDFRQSTTPLLSGGNGPVTLLVRLGGSLARPSVEADLEVGPARLVPSVEIPPVENLRLRAQLVNEVIELRELNATYQGMQVDARGQAPLAVLTSTTPEPGAGEASLLATLTGITSSVLSRFVDEATIEQIGGAADARIDLRSPSMRLEDVRGEIALDRLDLSVANLRVTQRQPTRLVAADGLVRIASWEWGTEGTSLGVQGEVNLQNRQMAILASGLIDARLLEPFLANPNIATAGQVDTRVSLTGPLAQPTVNGDLRLVGGEFRVRDPQIVAERLDAHAVLARGQVYLVSLGGLVNGGMMTGSGTLQYTPSLSGRLAMSIDGMAMNVPAGLRTEIDSNLEFQITEAKPQPWRGRLSGLVTVTRGSYREPMALVAGLLANLQRTSQGATVAAPSVLDRIALDVRVVTDDDIVVVNNVAEAELGADLRVINIASAPALSGRAELREGGQLFLGRNRYTVRTGTVDFANPTAIEPILDIDATTRVSGVDVEIRLSGPAQSLTTDLTSSSDPELGRADLTALLLTGRRLDDLSEGQAAAVGAQLFGNLAGDVLGVAGRAVGLDTLRVGGVDTTIIRDPADVAAEADPTSRLTFGKSIGSKVDVTLSQNLRDGGAQTWIVDYKPIRRLQLRFVSDDQELRSYQFRHDLVIGGPRAVTSGDVSRGLEPGRVTAVRITGRTQLSESELRTVLSLREGDRFDFLAWQRDRDRLAQLFHERHHLAARVDSSKAETAKGVELTYDVDPGPETRVRVSGADLQNSVMEALEMAWTNSVFDVFLTEEASGIVRRALARDGFYQPSVRSVITGDQALRTLDITIIPGPHVERVELRPMGIDDPLKSEVLNRVKDRLSDSPSVDAQSYGQALLDALRGLGYVRARVTAGEPAAEQTVLVIPFTVEPGPRFTIAGTTVQGATAVPEDVLLKDAAIAAGDVYRPAAIEDARTRIESRLRREGYPTATVDVMSNEDTSGATITVAFQAHEGPRQVVGDISVSGNRSVETDVITRALRLQVGDTLKPGDWLEARYRLFETGLFRRVDISTEPMEPEQLTVPVRVTILVEEWPALRIRYGLEVSEERPEDDLTRKDLVGGLLGDVTRRTLFGRAITVGAAGVYQRRQRLGRVFASAPTLFGLPVRSAMAVEQSHEDQRALTLIVDRTTASWEQRAVWRPLNLFYGLRFERNHTFDTEPPIDPNFPAFDLTVTIGRFNTGFSWDTRDDPANAVRGTFASSDLEYASSALGSDLFFVKSLSQYYRFQSWKGVVLASAARLGVAWPLRGQTLVPSQRFYAGGARTVRGVSEDALGGLDFLGIPIGGEGLVLLNQEARFPIFRWIRGVAFVDAGNAFARPRDISFNDLVVSTGVGLRVETPFVLLRVDYGRTVANRPVQDSGLWVFGIGHAF